MESSRHGAQESIAGGLRCSWFQSWLRTPKHRIRWQCGLPVSPTCIGWTRSHQMKQWCIRILVQELLQRLVLHHAWERMSDEQLKSCLAGQCLAISVAGWSDWLQVWCPKSTIDMGYVAQPMLDWTRLQRKATFTGNPCRKKMGLLHKCLSFKK